MSTIDKKRYLIIIGCILLIVLVFVFMFFYLKNQYAETAPKLTGTAKLVSSQDTNKEEEKENENPIIEKDEEITIYNSSEEIISLNASAWRFQETNFDGEYETDGLKYYYEAFTVERDGNSIPRIIFNENYKTDIVSGITVGMDMDKIEDILGNPVFKNKDYNMIGYKTQKLYLCIYENEIAVYRNEYFSNVALEEMILKYHNKEYTGSRNEFSKYIRNTYTDFNFTADEDRNIYLTSLVRGMVIKMGENDNEISVEYYKEYDNGNILTTNMLDNVVISDKYLVELMEIERNLEK